MSGASVWQKLGMLDRRIFYWILFIGLMIPYIRPIGLGITTTPPTEDLIAELKRLEPGEVCLLSINSGVSAWGDCLPGMIATVKQIFKQEAKLIVWGMGHADIDITWNEIRSRVPAFEGLEYGVDYAYFGFIPTQETTIRLLAQDIRQVFSQDVYGTPIDSISLMRNINSAENIRLVLSSDTGDVHGYYIRHWRNGPSRTPVAEIGIAMNKSGDMPYYMSGDLFGLSGGSRGAAELEVLIGEPGLATTTMDAISVSHILVVFAIILANIGYFATRGKS